MVECARIAVQYDARLCEFYERVKRRRGEQKALVAVVEDRMVYANPQGALSV